jgi:hypothetical protein
MRQVRGMRGSGRSVQIFLSYRRGDAGGHAGRLSDVLRQRLGAKSVFQDVTAIAPARTTPPRSTGRSTAATPSW